MCGIYGILNTCDRHPDRRVIDRMGYAMRHCGPDDAGIVEDGELMLGLKRLSIFDVDGGHQPIAIDNGTVVTVCNGKIYNLRSLRKKLIARGHAFKTGSDSEIIVHLYVVYGTDFIEHLSGILALAVWDSTRKRLLLTRDRLGIKPLYIVSTSNYLAFVSELQSIPQIPDFDSQIDSVTLHEYLALEYVPAPMTMLRDVEKLRPGTILICDREGSRRAIIGVYRKTRTKVVTLTNGLQTLPKRSNAPS